MSLFETDRRATARTLRELRAGEWGPGRVNQARQFLNKSKRSDAKREVEHQSRKRNRRRK